MNEADIFGQLISTFGPAGITLGITLYLTRQSREDMRERALAAEKRAAEAEAWQRETFGDWVDRARAKRNESTNP